MLKLIQSISKCCVAAYKIIIANIALGAVYSEEDEEIIISYDFPNYISNASELLIFVELLKIVLRLNQHLILHSYALDNNIINNHVSELRIKCNQSRITSCIFSY